MRLSALLAGLVVASGLGYWLIAGRPSKQAPIEGATSLPVVQVQPRRAVAVLGFKSLSGRAEAAWLSVALAEMLTVELAAGERLRMVPGESVARMKSDLALPEADTLSRETLGRVRSHLGTDLVVVGSYLAGDELRVNIRVQDVTTGETTAAVSETGTEAELIDLVSRIGSQLRQRLGVGQVSTRDADLVQAALPRNPEAARFYAEGLAKLHAFDALAGRDLLQKAVAAAPTHPLTHAALAQAWSALGYDVRALEEAKTAFELSATLPREDRLWVEGRYREAAREWDKAVDIYRTLSGFFPDNLDYGLRFASAQTEGGKGKEALATLEALRSLPGPMGRDPRIDMQEAWTALRLGDFKRVQTAADRAVQVGEAKGARLLVAEARVREADALRNLGELERSKTIARRAQEALNAAGDRASAARAGIMIANVLWQQGDLKGARRLYDETLALGKSIGAKRVVSASLNNIALILESQGDLGEARRLYEEAMALSREIGNRPALANQMSNVAEVFLRQGNLAEAKRLYEEALALRREVGNKDLAVPLVGLGALALRQGQLAGARARYEEAHAAASEAGNKRFGALALSGSSSVLSAEGDLLAARQKLEAALRIVLELGEKGTAAGSRLSLATLDIEDAQPQPARAERLAREAMEEFRKQRRADGEAGALAVLARALLGLGRTTEARTAVDQASSLIKKSQDKGVRLGVGITAARVRGASGRPADATEAIKSLEAVLAEATRLGFVPEQLEARLALAELEKASGRTAAALARLDTLEKDASARGFGLIAGKAARLRGAGP